MEIEWKLSPFKGLSTEELYAILKLRQQVFVVEQQCIYQDCDDQDKRAYHLAGWHDKGGSPEPIAYMRIMYPDKRSKLISLGRVLTHPNFRGKGFGKEIMARCLLNIEELYPESPVCISAQKYLTLFYESFGFRVSSDSYEEDGIPHIGMTRNPVA